MFLMDVLFQLKKKILKGMPNIYYGEELILSKLWFSQKENLKKCYNFEEQKGARYIRGGFILALSSSAVFRLLFVSQISFKLLCSGDKRLLSEYLREWGWFQGHNERFPKYLGKKLKLKKNWDTVLQIKEQH